MKTALLIISTLLFVGCAYDWSVMEDCLSEVPQNEQIGVQSALKYVHYEEIESLDWKTFSSKYTRHVSYRSQCFISCKTGYSLISYSKCMADSIDCDSSELPANAVSGTKSLRSDGTYAACKAMTCSTGYSLNTSNGCDPVFGPPPPIDPCLINPADPMCI